MGAVAKVRVIIVTHNSLPYLHRCLNALPAAWQDAGSKQGIPYRVLVVDNASTDGTVAWMSRQGASFRWHAFAENRGFAAAVNWAVQTDPEEDDILLLNPDTLPLPGSLHRLWQTLAEYPQAAVVGPAVLKPQGGIDPRGARTFPSLRREAWDKLGAWRWPRHPWSRRYYLGEELAEREEPQPVPALSGAVMLIRRVAWQQVGGMDERFWLYMEDIDLCRRLQQAGWMCLYEPRARVVHWGGGSVSPANALAMGMVALSSTEKYFRKHHGWTYALAYRWLMASLALLKGVYWGIRGDAYHLRVQAAVLSWALGRWRERDACACGTV